MAILLGSYQEKAKVPLGILYRCFVCVTMVEALILYLIL